MTAWTSRPVCGGAFKSGPPAAIDFEGWRRVTFQPMTCGSAIAAPPTSASSSREAYRPSPRCVRLLGQPEARRKRASPFGFRQETSA